jgi:hypothetical protein
MGKQEEEVGNLVVRSDGEGSGGNVVGGGEQRPAVEAQRRRRAGEPEGEKRQTGEVP